MVKELVFGAATVCSGCSMLPGRLIYLDGQDEAMETIWRETYGVSKEPPSVFWVMEDEQTCIDPVSGRGGFKVPFLPCREGLTLSSGAVHVSWHEGDTFDATALAHEFAHAAQALHGAVDPLHKLPEFQPGGAVDQANARLAEEGL